MRIDVVTLFPELFEPLVRLAMVGRAIDIGALSIRLRSPRDFGIGRHRTVDDTPYGGGPGMVMRVDCVVRCLESLDDDAPREPDGRRAVDAHRVLLSPQGRRLDQRTVAELAERPAVCLVCGRYEGFDERVRGYVHEEVSIGDFVLAGGEVAAMAIIDACSRLLPGVLGNADSLAEESHSPANGGLLEYPQYTRPVDFRGARVPPVLQGGHHAQIAAWRRQQAWQRTRDRRPDLIATTEGPPRHPASSGVADSTVRAGSAPADGAAMASRRGSDVPPSGPSSESRGGGE